MNVCAAGHDRHNRKQVGCRADYLNLTMNIYDTSDYMGFAGYCTGQDDISQTLERTGVWEPVETEAVMSLLRYGRKEGMVLDFGTHIGWYTIIAGLMGYKVRGFEGDAENIELLEQNARNNGVEDKVDVALAWIDKDYPPLDYIGHVTLMKCDLEGNDQWAVAVCKQLFERGQIDFALIEISPCFNDSYPKMVNWIKAQGYKAYFVEPQPKGAAMREFDDNYDFNQINLLFSRTAQ